MWRMLSSDGRWLSKDNGKNAQHLSFLHLLEFSPNASPHMSKPGEHLMLMPSSPSSGRLSPDAKAYQ
eukprot:5308494-Pyramimonas_sp.AAC.1